MRLCIPVAFVIAVLSYPAHAAGPYTPVALTPDSFNEDIVVEAGAANASAAVTATQDSLGFAWNEIGYSAAAPITGLPHAGLIVPTADRQSSFFFQPYTGNNVLLLRRPNKSVGTLKLATPITTSSLAFATASAIGNAQISVKLHFADGAADLWAPSFTSPDWFGQPAPRVTHTHGRVYTPSGLLDIRTMQDDPFIYMETISLPAAAGHPISSIDLSTATLSTPPSSPSARRSPSHRPSDCWA